MGFTIKDSAADFSQHNVGSSSKAGQYIKTGGITNAVYKAAITSLYNGLLSDEILSKISVLNLMGSGIALADSLNLINPQNTDGAFRMQFVNDTPGAHTTGGFLPDPTALRYGRTTMTLAAGGFSTLNDIGLHAYNTTPALSAPGGATRHMAAVNTAAADSNLTIFVRRVFNGGTGGAIDAFTGAATVSAFPYDSQKTGLLSAVRNGSDFKLYDKGVQIATQTKTISPIIRGDERLLLGTIDPATSGAFFEGKLLAFCITKGFNAADTLKLSSRLDMFRSQIGA